MTTMQLETPTPGLLDAAEAHLEDIRRKIGAGDPSVTADDLDRAERAVRFAATRQEEAAKHAAEVAEQARLRRIDELCVELERLAADTTVQKAAGAMGKAIDAYCAAAKRTEERRAEIHDELIRIGELPSHVRIEPTMSAVVVNGTAYRPALVQPTIARAARAALKQHFPRHQINLNQQ